MPSLYPLVRLDTDELPSGPWIFGRSVARPSDMPEDGAIVEVEDRTGRFVGHALFNSRSDIRLRLLSRGKRSDLRQIREFLLRHIASADRLRKKTLRLHERTDAWRVVHAEGDDLSGLVVDKLGGVLVCEYHALGFWRLRREIESVLAELHPGLPVHHRVPKSVRSSEDFEPEEEPQAQELWIQESGLEYPVVPAAGHKTGWFCDQRENRLLVGRYARGQDVLDVCSNLGGFSLHAARAGARRVRAVDLDEEALARAERAAQRNKLAVECVHADGFDFLRAERARTERPSLVVLDPHKLVTNKANLEAGLVKYRDFNTLALEVVRPGGLLFTFSCSGAVDLPTFLGTVFFSARRAGREVRLLEVLGAGPDHPQRPDFARSRYLKGAMLAVD